MAAEGAAAGATGPWGQVGEGARELGGSRDCGQCQRGQPRALPWPNPAFPLLLHSPMAQAKVKQRCPRLPLKPPPHCDTSSDVTCAHTASQDPRPALGAHRGTATPSCPGQPRPWCHPNAVAHGWKVLPRILLHVPQMAPKEGQNEKRHE